MTIADFVLAVDQLARFGSGLSRPENVLAFRDGTVFASSNRGSIIRIATDGTQWEIGDLPGGQPTTMALAGETGLIVNDTGDGNLYRLGLDGRHELVLDTVDGRPLGSANFVFEDSQRRLWIAVATRRRPPHIDLPVQPDGYIAVMDDSGVRVVADGLYWPNEVRLDATERYAYVPETMARRLLRFRVAEDGALSDKHVLGPDPLGDATFPDGIALDQEGNIWIATISRNGLMIMRPDGRAHTVFEQPQLGALTALRAAHAAGRVPLQLLAACAGPDLRLLTSVGFGGPDLTTVFMGSLALSELVCFTSPVAGLPLQHQHRAAAPPQPTPVTDRTYLDLGKGTRHGSS